MAGQKRAFALLLCAALLFLLLVSSALLVVHANHDCSGEGCEICALLDLCALRLRQLATALILVAWIAAVTRYLRLYAANTEFSPASRTLVALKIKLSN